MKVFTSRLFVSSLLGFGLLAGCNAVIGSLTERTADGPTGDASTPEAQALLDARPSEDAGDATPPPKPDAACTPQALSVTCASKSCGPAVDDCGNPVVCPDTCKDGAVCGSGGVNVCGPASCVGPGDGVANCGASGTGSCCASSLVIGKTYDRSSPGDPATVATFRLDDYEVTVGRFRKFVAAALAGYRPAAASGRHSHLTNGLNGGSEVGWNALDWNAFLPQTSVQWAEALACGGALSTSTTAPGPNEKRPQNCVSWYAMYAFCIWDGGFLPTEAEWQLAATAGGTRLYPWAGGVQPGANADLGAWGCYFNGTGTCSGPTNVAPVGAIAAGVGAYGQYDLGGNVNEWVLDATPAPYDTCINCASLPSGSPVVRIMRGGHFNGDFPLMQGARRNQETARNGYPYVGGRCARTP